jgi:hypothetical protein
MIFYECFFFLMLGVLLLTTVRGRDAFPFSHYPMFSDLHDVADIRIFRLALEKQTGEILWWHSEFYRYPEIVGRKLKQSFQSADGSEKTDVFVLLDRKKYLAEVLRLIEIEEGGFESYRAFHIVERRVRQTENAPEIADKTIAVIPFREIRSGIYS